MECIDIQCATHVEKNTKRYTRIKEEKELIVIKGERMKKQTQDMTLSELFYYVIETCTVYAVYMNHIKRYYPKVHNKAVSTKTFLKQMRRNNEK